eukprot:gb/GECG01008281.1/.p1 GENE.gb/GECG01008281.1/~~gb/GECG01008281.1/.p1  ORF type:complete len:101 (+),score=14.84 gb/GECG01008281.1/:1-303(+)
MASRSAALKHIKFEVFGKVQGVFFRKYTQKKAQELHLVGWVRNAPSGSVQGVAQGPVPAIEEFKKFLQYEGSPQSKIEKAEFRDEKGISEPEFSSFGVRK